jgi:hypothetical protein
MSATVARKALRRRVWCDGSLGAAVTMDLRPRSSIKRRRASGGWRQAWVVIAFGITLALAALAGDEYVVLKRQAAAAANAPGDEEIYTGSILYMPDEGNVCRQLLFDNHDGHFADNGYVDCERAFYQGGPDAPKQWSAARLRVISNGFRH